MVGIGISQEAGMKSETFFSSLLDESGIDYKFVDRWYDYEIAGHKVELKSCQMTIKNYIQRKNGRVLDGWKVGRFYFQSDETRKKIVNENVWLALVVRHRNQFIMYGFIQGKNIQSKSLSIHKARELNPIGFEDWIKLMKKDVQTKEV